jgi:dynactin complex subunit
MSKTNLSIGERVSLIPFKHKGKIGTVKFIGEIEGKNQGNWVGIELDEAHGDCNGESGDTQIFECKEGHGIFLRPT